MAMFVIVVTADAGEMMVPEPDTNDQLPVPIAGTLAFKVVEDEQSV